MTAWAAAKAASRQASWLPSISHNSAAMPSRTRQDIDDTLARAQHDILDLGDRLGGVARTTCSGLVLPQDHADFRQRPQRSFVQ